MQLDMKGECITRGEFLWESLALCATLPAATGERLKANGVAIEAGAKKPFRRFV